MGQRAADNPHLVDLEEWRRKASTGEAQPDAVLRKEYAVRVKAEGGESRKVAIVISTKGLDRMGDTVDPLGIDVSNFEKNPVVLWAHSHYIPPIARSVSLKASSKALRSVAEFMPADLSPFADSVFQMLKGGWLNAASIGFLPKRGGFEYDPERGGFDFRKTELLEYSIVPVPANPQALVSAKSAGVPMAPLITWAEQVLEELAPERGGVKALAAALRKELVGTTVAVPAQAIPEQKAAPDAPAPVVMLAKDPSFLVDPNAVKAAMQAAVSETVAREVNFWRGRID